VSAKYVNSSTSRNHEKHLIGLRKIKLYEGKNFKSEHNIVLEFLYKSNWWLRILEILGKD